MNAPGYTDFAILRAELLCDYAPATAQERLLVDEVATCWLRLAQSRHREYLFFDLQKTAEAIRSGQSPDSVREGAEVLMWLDHPHQAYDQILRSIRDAGNSFDRAIRRVEQVIATRRKTTSAARESRPSAHQARSQAAAPLSAQPPQHLHRDPQAFAEAPPVALQPAAIPNPAPHSNAQPPSTHSNLSPASARAS